MKETGIIMSGSHPLDIIEGRKTMTRRTRGLEEINKEPDDWKQPYQLKVNPQLWTWRSINNGGVIAIKCPYGGVGDLLWVKETFYTDDEMDPRVLYKADGLRANFNYGGPWRPSIFMPRWASRITREITEVRVERLQGISPRDACAEGIGDYGRSTPQRQYRKLWNSLNAKRGYGWESNPWVWVISFKRI